MLTDRNPISGSWCDLENSLPSEYPLLKLGMGIQVISSVGNQRGERLRWM